jgi:hypothetical protein
MDKGTKHNIMIELGMTSDQFNLVTVAYYVCIHRFSRTKQPLTNAEDTIHRRGSTVKPRAQVYEAISVAGTCDGTFLSLPFHVAG